MLYSCTFINTSIRKGKKHLLELVLHNKIKLCNKGKCSNVLFKQNIIIYVNVITICYLIESGSPVYRNMSYLVFTLKAEQLNKESSNHSRLFFITVICITWVGIEYQTTFSILTSSLFLKWFII